MINVRIDNWLFKSRYVLYSIINVNFVCMSVMVNRIKGFNRVFNWM